MDIREEPFEVEGTCSYPVVRFMGDGRVALDEAPVQVEHALDVAIDGRLAFKVVCSPSNLVDLALGRLLTEGLISGPDDVASASLAEDASRVDVELARKTLLDVPAFEQVPTTGTGGATYAAAVCAPPLEPVKPISWDPAWIRALAEHFARDTPMHKKTHGAHSCSLAVDGDVLCCREDLGRHNAFDKVVGHALRTGIDLSHAVLLTSGRVPVDMVSKAIRARVPLLVSAAVPTNLTIRMALRYRLTLVGLKDWPASFTVYSHPAALIG